MSPLCVCVCVCVRVRARARAVEVGAGKGAGGPGLRAEPLGRSTVPVSAAGSRVPSRSLTGEAEDVEWRQGLEEVPLGLLVSEGPGTAWGWGGEGGLYEQGGWGAPNFSWGHSSHLG